jgi:hypothetical protein
MDTARTVEEIKADLHDFAASLSRIDDSVMPPEALRRGHYLARRKNLLEGLVETTQELQTAHATAQNPDAAAALAEPIEHYRHQLGLAYRAHRLNLPHALEALRSKPARHTETEIHDDHT